MRMYQKPILDSREMHSARIAEKGLRVSAKQQQKMRPLRGREQSMPRNGNYRHRIMR